VPADDPLAAGLVDDHTVDCFRASL